MAVMGLHHRQWYLQAMIPNKDRIRQRFSRAASTYDRQAVIQHQVAERLVTLLGQYHVLPTSRILEIGSCTGLLTEHLAERFRGLATLYVNDLVPDFESSVIDRTYHNIECTFLAGDIESIDIPADLDLVASSSTFHWMEDFPALIKKLHDHMVPESTLAFSMYSTANLQELRAITGIGLRYYSLDELKQIVGRYFTLRAGEEELVTYYFQNPLDVLNHLRETGVNSLDGTTWSRSRLNSFIGEYKKRFGDGQQVHLTYHPTYIIAQKKR